MADEGDPIGGMGFVIAGTLAVLIGLGVLFGTGYFDSKSSGAKADPPKAPAAANK
ncbi:MAG TPA: hypothetical protein VFK79_12800 [Xanthobacteraceae bacterium]|nr:hypothetical protein [Xanthobacteraceae bacterium]